MSRSEEEWTKMLSQLSSANSFLALGLLAQLHFQLDQGKRVPESLLAEWFRSLVEKIESPKSGAAVAASAMRACWRIPFDPSALDRWLTQFIQSHCAQTAGKARKVDAQTLGQAIRAASRLSSPSEGLLAAVETLLEQGATGSVAARALSLLIAAKRTHYVDRLFVDARKPPSFMKSFEKMYSQAERLAEADNHPTFLDERDYDLRSLLRIRTRFSEFFGERGTPRASAQAAGQPQPTRGSSARPKKGYLNVSTHAPGHEEGGGSTLIRKSQLPGVSQKQLDRMSPARRDALLAQSPKVPRGHRRGKKR